VIKNVEFGIYLDGDDLGEILMPNRYVPLNCKLNDILEVFLYFDSEDRIIATTEIPLAQVGEFAFLEVIATGKYGAFLDWGLPKDLLVPFKQQNQTMEVGKKYLVFVYLDKQTNRIAASTHLDTYILDFENDFNQNDEVEIIIVGKTDLGYKAIIENSYWGVIYENELFKPVQIGQKMFAYIKKIRQDYKIDLSLYKSGYERIEDNSTILLRILNENNGFLPFSDRTSPELIHETFGFSKRTFKQTIGLLFRERKIRIEDDGIYLLSQVD
jgi:hypothetical protein